MATNNYRGEGSALLITFVPRAFNSLQILGGPEKAGHVHLVNR